MDPVQIHEVASPLECLGQGEVESTATIANDQGALWKGD